MVDSTPKSYSADPTLYLYTSLSSGSSHIVTATSRLETILKANKIPFRALDVATDEKARMLWGRRAGKRKLPGLVRMGMVVGDLDEVEEWNEYGEIQEQLGSSAPAPTAASTPAVSTTNTPSKPAAATAPKAGASNMEASTPSRGDPAVASTAPRGEENKKPALHGDEAEKPKQAPSSGQSSIALAMRQLGSEAAAQAKKAKQKALSASTSSPTKPGDVDESTKESKDISEATPSEPLHRKDAFSEGTTATKVDSKMEDPAPLDAGIASLRTESSIDSDTSSTAVANASTTSLSNTSDATEKGIYTTHRGSSVSIASREQIQAIEAVTRIDEDPAAEDEETQQINKPAKSSEPHVTFKGETGGSEIEKVKATLTQASELLEGTPKSTSSESKGGPAEGSTKKGGSKTDNATSSSESKNSSPSTDAVKKPTAQQLDEPIADPGKRLPNESGEGASTVSQKTEAA